MRIGIELESAAQVHCDGLAPYLECLVKTLCSAQTQHDFLLFWPEGRSTPFTDLVPFLDRLEIPGPFFQRLGREFRRRRFDVLFRSYPYEAPLDIPLESQVVLVPDLRHEFFQELLGPVELAQRLAAFRNVVSKAGALVTATDHERRALLTHPATRSQRVVVAGPALLPLETAENLSEAERSLLPQRPFLLCPGEIQPHKNHHRVCRAMEKFLTRSDRPFDLVLTGPAEGWPALAVEFPKLPMTHLGFVGHDLLMALCRQAAGLICFSLHEGFSTDLLEAFRAGTPVACSQTSGLAEIAGDAALTCDPNNVDAIAETLHRLTHDRAHCSNLVQRGLTRLSTFDRHAAAKNLIDVLEQVGGASPNKRFGGWLRQRAKGELQAQANALTRTLKGTFNPLVVCAKKSAGRLFRAKIGVLQQYAPRPMKLPAYYAKEVPPQPAPRISIVTPSFNHIGFLERTMRSVLDQNYPNCEYIVQDGGSNDGTVALLRRYSERLAHWESIRDRGQSHAINLGFRHATGDIMAYLNSDDLLLPGSLAYVARYFDANPKVDVVYSHRILIDAENYEVGRWILPPHDDQSLLWADYIPQETMFWRRSIWEKVDAKIDESFQFAMDWDLLLRFRQAGARFERLPRFLGAFRTHAAQKTVARFVDLYFPEVRRLRERAHGRPVALAEINEAVRPYQRRHLLFHHLYSLGLLRC
jgi:glycosyltransferase involved in cell wall biosynthesis/GT2 family glycosyltransferase